MPGGTIRAAVEASADGRERPRERPRDGERMRQSNGTEVVAVGRNRHCRDNLKRSLEPIVGGSKPIVVTCVFLNVVTNCPVSTRVVSTLAALAE